MGDCLVGTWSGVSAGEVVGEVTEVGEVAGEVTEVVWELAEVVGEIAEVPDTGVVTSGIKWATWVNRSTITHIES